MYHQYYYQFYFYFYFYFYLTVQFSSVQFSSVQFNMNTQPIVNPEIKNPFSMKGNLSDFKKAFPGISNLDEAYVAPVVPPVRRRVIKQKTT